MLVCLKDWLDTEVRDHNHSNIYDCSKYAISNSGSSRYDSDNMPQNDNEDEDYIPKYEKIITKRYAFYIVHITSFLKIFLNIVLIKFLSF
jgi:hypothetical protein